MDLPPSDLPPARPASGPRRLIGRFVFDLRLAARLGALGERDFALFLTGYTLSLVGSAMVPVALSFAMFAASPGHGAGRASAALAAETAPMVLLILLGGVIADRLPRRAVMVAADLLRCAAQGAMALLLLLSAQAPLWAVMLLAALVGIGNAFYVPGRNGLVPQIVSPRHLQSANALCAIAQSSGGIAGPVLAGLLVAAAGPGVAIALDCASYAIGAALLLSLRPVRPPEGTGSSLLRDLRDGWTEFTRRRWVWLIVAQFGLLHLLVIGPMMILGALGFSHRPEGALGWGGLLSMYGVGSILGGLAGLRLRPARPIRFALILFLLYPLLPASLAIGLPYRLQAVCFLLGGLSVSVFNVLWETTLQRAIPPALFSRVAAYDVFGSLCLLPVGYAIAGPLADLLGTPGALWMGAGFALLSTLAVLVPRDVRTTGAGQAAQR